MAKAIVQCRICKGKFDRNSKDLVEGVDFVHPSNRMYYHKKCYDEYQQSKHDIHSKGDNQMWFDASWEFIRNDLKYSPNFHKFQAQWNSFLKNKMTAKGIYFALRYFYEIKKADIAKSEGGIGIIPHIYEESCSYWQEREQRSQGVCAEIERQIRQAEQQKTVVINLKKKKDKKTSNLLDEIMGLEDDE